MASNGYGRVLRLLFISCCVLITVRWNEARAETENLDCIVPEAPQAAALFTHGLNQHTRSLASLRKLLYVRHTAVCQLRLSGHRPGTEKHAVSADAWAEEFAAAAEAFAARFPSLPRFSVNYSVGAALAVSHFDSSVQRQFDRAVLIAPAVALSWKAALLRPLLPFRVFNFSLPSAAPKEHRVYSSTSLDAYAATVKLADRARKLTHPERLRSMPLLVLVSEEDELVDSDGVRDWCREHELDCRFFLFEGAPEVEGTYAHLMVDRETLGRTEWTRMSRLIVEFLELSSTEVEDERHEAAPTADPTR